jgi:hypothetical protein
MISNRILILAALHQTAHNRDFKKHKLLSIIAMLKNRVIYLCDGYVCHGPNGFESDERWTILSCSSSDRHLRGLSIHL